MKKTITIKNNLIYYISIGGFILRISDSFFKRVEDKTKVNKDTILSLADKLQSNNMKDEKTLREVVREISNITGKSVSKEKEDKIIKTIINDEVPDDLDKYVKWWVFI